jgi:hypothetical protein
MVSKIYIRSSHSELPFSSCGGEGICCDVPYGDLREVQDEQEKVQGDAYRNPIL